MASARICKIDGCGKPVRGRGFCNAHWLRWSRHGDPLGGRTSPGKPERYFCDVVLPYDGDECLLWPYGCHSTGYGSLSRNGRAQTVHRLVCVAIHGAPPTTKHEVAHSCGKGHLGCCAPGHLSWKTRKENHADKLVHDTHQRGERHPLAKLTVSDVREIRSMRGLLFQREIAALYGIDRALVSMIISRRSWSWLE